MAKNKKVTSKTYFRLVKDWKNDIKTFKKALNDTDNENFKDITKQCFMSTEKLYAFAKTNQDKLLAENPKNNQKTYDAMIKDIKKFHDYIKKHHDIYAKVDEMVKL